MRRRIFEIIEVSQENDLVGYCYDVLMLCAIIVSIVPLAFKETPRLFYYTDTVTTALFIIDYVLRLITADYKLKKGPVLSFIRYPFTLWSIIDLLSILPTITILNSGFKLLRISRMVRIFRVFRVFKSLRYSESVSIIAKVIRNSKDALIAVGTLAVGYILISALVIFNVEGDSFETFFDAIYWATVSLTTVGYGDIYPVTTAGRVVTMLSSVFGIAIVALPAGIITAGYMGEICDEGKNDDQSDQE